MKWFVLEHLAVIHLLVQLILNANTLEKIIQEMLLSSTSERQGRLIDSQMQMRPMEKQEGYF